MFDEVFHPFNRQEVVDIATRRDCHFTIDFEARSPISIFHVVFALDDDEWKNRMARNLRRFAEGYEIAVRIPA